MHDDDMPPQQPGETFLPLFLTVLAGAGFLIFLVALGGLLLGGFGPLIAIVVVAPCILVFGFLHYLLWGHNFSQEVAGEREEEDRMTG